MLLETKTKIQEATPFSLSLSRIIILHQRQPTFIKEITKTHMQGRP
jgi:hypothetical protein